MASPPSGKWRDIDQPDGIVTCIHGYPLKMADIMHTEEPLTDVAKAYSPFPPDRKAKNNRKHRTGGNTNLVEQGFTVFRLVRCSATNEWDGRDVLYLPIIWKDKIIMLAGRTEEPL